MRILIGLLAVVVALSAAPAMAAPDKTGSTSCVSPKTVTTFVVGSKNHKHKHGSVTYWKNSESVQIRTTTHNAGHTSTSWALNTTGVFNAGSSYGTCTT